MGVLLGAAVFFVPFLIVRTIFFFMIVGLFFRLFWWGVRGRNHRMRYHMAWADKVRNMSDEEYAAFKNRAGQHCYHHGFGHNPQSKNESK